MNEGVLFAGMASADQQQASLADSMDMDEADMQSPAHVSVDPAAADPVEPIWSPQYSPKRLADLLPENLTSVRNAPPHARALAPSQSMHTMGLPEMHSSSLELAAHQQRHSGDVKPSLPPAAQSHHPSLHNGDVAGGHEGQEYPQHQPAGGDYTGSSGMHMSPAPRHQSPPPPLPSDPVQTVHQVTFHRLGMNSGASLAAVSHPGGPPVALSAAHLAGFQNTSHGYQQHDCFPTSEQYDMQSADDGIRQPGVNGSVSTAPGHFHQSEQKPQMAHIRPAYQQSHTVDAHANRPQGPSSSHFDAHYSAQAVSEQRPGHLHMLQLHQAHGHMHQSGSHPHPAGMQQPAPIQSEHSHMGHQVGGGAQASTLPDQYEPPEGKYVLSSAPYQGLPVQNAAAQSLHCEHQPGKPHHMLPIKTQPGTSAPMTGGFVQGQHSCTHHAAAHDMPLHAQSLTVLSPELSAALAAGMLGQRLAGSAQRPPSTIQHQPTFSQKPMYEPQARDASSATAAALPPELSAALASGQLSLQLGPTAASQHNQEAALPPHSPSPFHLGIRVLDQHSETIQRDSCLQRHPLPHPHQAPAQPPQHGMQGTARLHTHHVRPASPARKPMQGGAQMMMTDPSMNEHPQTERSLDACAPQQSHNEALRPGRLQPVGASVPEQWNEQHQQRFEDATVAQHHHQHTRHGLQARQYVQPLEHEEARHWQGQPDLQHLQDPHLQRSELHQKLPMQASHSQQMSGAVQRPHAGPVRREDPQHFWNQSQPGMAEWEDERQMHVQQPAHRPPHHMTGPPSGDPSPVHPTKHTRW